MGHEGGLAMLVATFVAFGVVSISLYILVLRPILPNDGATATRTAAATNSNTPNNRNRGRVAPDTRNNTATNNTAASAASNTSSGSSSIDKILAECARFPIHVAPASQSSSSSRANLLVEGLLAFRHSRAASYEQTKAANGGGGDATAQNRKERARILSRMLALEEASAESGNPPIRGSTIVVSTPLAEVGCPKLRRVLFLFSTYYNLLVILVVPSGTTASDVEKATEQLRGKADDGEERLDPECLPDHRIVASSSSTGRIAFVRQLGKVEVVVDFDTEVKTQLSRFGYRVINYKKQLSDKTASQLGNQLLS